MNPPPALVDTHAHLDDRRLKGRLVEVFRSAREAGVVQVIAVSTTADDSESVAALARTHPGVFAAVGVHPNDAVDAMNKTYDKQVDKLPGKAVLDEIDAKVDQAKLETFLMEEGLSKFADPQKGLLKAIAGKKKALVGK